MNFQCIGWLVGRIIIQQSCMNISQGCIWGRGWLEGRGGGGGRGAPPPPPPPSGGELERRALVGGDSPIKLMVFMSFNKYVQGIEKKKVTLLSWYYSKEV